jgi:N-acetylglucosamine-6-phosphate deacetylase
VSVPPLVVANARVATPERWLEDGWLLVEDGAVAAVGAGTPPSGVARADVGGRVVAPGFVDVHVHGGEGAFVNQETADEVATSVRALARFHARHGTTALVPTTVSDSPERLRACLAGIASCVARRPGDAEVLGSHLEGPWLAPTRRGAHAAAMVRPPDVVELDALLDVAGGSLRLLTIAPELPGAGAVIDAARAGGVAVSIGHTDADYDTARAAFDHGITHVTHLCNAMAPLHHRRPGAVGAALLDSRATLELIADGHHVHRAVLGVVARTAPGRVVLVSDAVAAAGLGPGRHRLGSQDIDVAGDRVTLADDPDTLAGSVLTLDRAVALMASAGAMTLLEALRAASLTPAQAVGARYKGRLEPGADADLVVLDDELTPLAVMARGVPCHDPCSLLTPVAAPAG